jgi:hypothetical protein
MAPIRAMIIIHMGALPELTIKGLRGGVLPRLKVNVVSAVILGGSCGVICAHTARNDRSARRKREVEALQVW